MAGRILIADSVATGRITLKVKLAAARYDCLLCVDGAEAIARARAERPDVVILDADLDGAAVAICARLKADPLTRAIPVLFVAAAPSRTARLAAFHAGAEGYLTKSADDIALLALVRNLMRGRASLDELLRRQDTEAALGFADSAGLFRHSPRVAVIAPSGDAGLIWQRQLARRLPARVQTLAAGHALDPLPPELALDAYVVAADLQGHGDGLRLISELRSRPASRHAVLVVVGEAEDRTVPAIALDIGADAVSDEGFDAEELAARLRVLLARKLETDALREGAERRLSQATLDPLTGAYNRLYADTYLQRLAEEAGGNGTPFALMLVDLDRFKAVNDSFGHLAGDEVLIETTRRLRDNLRQIDLLARYGGEEFVIAMPETDLAGAAAIAERLRRVIAERPMPAASAGREIAITVSIGVAVCTGGLPVEAVPRALMMQADAALYASKHEGRNLVTFAGGDVAA